MCEENQSLTGPLLLSYNWTAQRRGLTNGQLAESKRKTTYCHGKNKIKINI